MRVISGKYGGRILRGPSDSRTRPTSDRLRETLFNILAPDLGEGTRFLDLCAGTGAVGIEALSRGAEAVAFVDRSRRACGLIEENLDNLEVPEESTEVFCMEADRFLIKKPDPVWDIVFYDPPYSEDYDDVIELIGGEASPLAPGGMLIVEHHSKNELPDEAGGLRRWRLLKQGETCLSFYERG